MCSTKPQTLAESRLLLKVTADENERLRVALVEARRALRKALDLAAYAEWAQDDEWYEKIDALRKLAGVPHE